MDRRPLSREAPLALDFQTQSAIGLLLGSDTILRQMNGTEIDRLILSGAYTRMTTP